MHPSGHPYHYAVSPALVNTHTAAEQVLHFTQRVQIFHHLIEKDKAMLGLEGPLGGLDVRVSREKIYEDAMRTLDPLGEPRSSTLLPLDSWPP